MSDMVNIPFPLRDGTVCWFEFPPDVLPTPEDAERLCALFHAVAMPSGETEKEET